MWRRPGACTIGQRSSPVRPAGREPGRAAWLSHGGPLRIPSEFSPALYRRCGRAVAWSRGSWEGRRQDRDLPPQGEQSRARRTLATRPPQVCAVGEDCKGWRGVCKQASRRRCQGGGAEEACWSSQALRGSTRWNAFEACLANPFRILNGLGVHTQAWREGQRWYDRRLTCEARLP
jgi:hypothetical protein